MLAHSSFDDFQYRKPKFADVERYDHSFLLPSSASNVLSEPQIMGRGTNSINKKFET